MLILPKNTLDKAIKSINFYQISTFGYMSFWYSVWQNGSMHQTLLHFCILNCCGCPEEKHLLEPWTSCFALGIPFSLERAINKLIILGLGIWWLFFQKQTKWADTLGKTTDSICCQWQNGEFSFPNSNFGELGFVVVVVFNLYIQHGVRNDKLYRLSQPGAWIWRTHICYFELDSFTVYKENILMRLMMTVTCDVEGNIVIMKFVSIWKSS